MVLKVEFVGCITTNSWHPNPNLHVNQGTMQDTTIMGRAFNFSIDLFWCVFEVLLPFNFLYLHLFSIFAKVVSRIDVCWTDFLTIYSHIYYTIHTGNNKHVKKLWCCVGMHCPKVNYKKKGTFSISGKKSTVCDASQPVNKAQPN